MILLLNRNRHPGARRLLFVVLDKLCGLVGDKVFHPLHEKSIAPRSVDRVVACADRVKLFLSRERLNEGAVVQPVFVKLE